MKKVYLVYKCMFNDNGVTIEDQIINAFSNKRKAENYKRYRTEISENESQYFYIVPLNIETFDYGAV